jgi:hypothetical protein
LPMVCVSVSFEGETAVFQRQTGVFQHVEW